MFDGPSVVKRLNNKNWRFYKGMEILEKHTFPKLIRIGFVTLLKWGSNLLIGDIDDILIGCLE